MTGTWTPADGAWIVVGIPPNSNGIPTVTAVAMLDEMAAHAVAVAFHGLGCRALLVDVKGDEDEAHTIEEYHCDGL